MKTKLKHLIQGLDVEIKGKKDIEIAGICSHSRQVAPGDLFFALKGDKVDGSLFIEEALRAGANAIMTDLYNPFLTHVTQLICKNPSLYLAEIARRFYKDPSQDLFLVGITGTNGKTTTSYLVRHLLEAKSLCGLIGTIETIIKQHTYPSQLTTPDLLFLNKSMSEMVKKGCKSCVMEVSSHGLAQKRTEGLEFDVAVFTNLSQDHLDYHGTMENYAQAKALLFSQMQRYKNKKHKLAVVNKDDPYFSTMIASCKQPIMTYGIKEKDVDLKAHAIFLGPKGCQFKCTYQGQTVTMFTPLIGQFNIYNTLAAIAVALHAGLSLNAIEKQLASFTCVKGRLEKIENAKDLSVYVDFAHTDKALENVLKTVRYVTKGKLIVVAGCGGDRDPGKRSLMGQVAQSLADLAIFTSDNPRSEDPKDIINQMLVAVKSSKNILIEEDRQKAIEKALEYATKNDTILIAGKGHETTQIFKDKTLYFSDAAVVQEFLGK
jgi:UDP-N-acetylmuramoyl-L-alanyl-D-glutamate--2,6-diaminopimelate ligase